MSKPQTSMVECPQCKRQYPAGTWKCLHDGFLLPPADDDDDPAQEEPTELGPDAAVAEVTNPRTAFMHVEELIDTEQGNKPPVLEPTMEEISAPVDDEATAVIRKKDFKNAVDELDSVVQESVIGKDTLREGELDAETAVVSRAALRARDTRPSPPVAPRNAPGTPPPGPPTPTPAPRTPRPAPRTPRASPPPLPPGVGKDMEEDPDAETYIQRVPLPGATPAPPPAEDSDSETVVLNRDALKAAPAVEHDAETYIQRDDQKLVDHDAETYIQQDDQKLVDHDAETYIQQDGQKLVDLEAETKVKPKVVAPPGAPAMGLVGKQMGDYSLMRLIRAGALEWVYEARNQQSQERAAVRLVHPDVARGKPEATRHFLEDADTVNRIGHKNVVEMFEHRLDPAGHSFQVTELLEGESLETHINRVGRLPVRRTVGILLQVCAALKTAHGAMILHRDLGPEHIFLTSRASRDDLVKVLNFGLAKLLDQIPPGQAPTSPYSPPERINGRPPKDPRSDIYSLGVLLYRMLSGNLPFSDLGGAPAPADRPDPPPITDDAGAILPALNGVVMCCLSSNPTQRYPNVVSLEQALQTAVHGQTESPFAGVEQQSTALVPDYRPGHTPQVVVPSGGGRRVVTIMVAAFFTLFVAAGGIWALGRYWPAGVAADGKQAAAAAEQNAAVADEDNEAADEAVDTGTSASGAGASGGGADSGAPGGEDAAPAVASAPPSPDASPPDTAQPKQVARETRPPRRKGRRAKKRRKARGKKGRRKKAANASSTVPSKKSKKISADTVKKDPFGD